MIEDGQIHFSGYAQDAMEEGRRRGCGRRELLVNEEDAGTVGQGPLPNPVPQPCFRHHHRKWFILLRLHRDQLFFTSYRPSVYSILLQISLRSPSDAFIVLFFIKPGYFLNMLRSTFSSLLRRMPFLLPFLQSLPSELPQHVFLCLIMLSTRRAPQPSSTQIRALVAS
jgi:hypothetical protein